MDKEQIAIERLKTASEMSIALYQKPLIVCHSGGKDSVVITELARRSGIPFIVSNQHTTVDAPETVYYIRDEFKRLEGCGIDCSINYPSYKGKRTNMWELIVTKLMPPTRLARYCCEVLKETSEATRNSFIVTGVRWEESTKRKSRGIYETIAKGKEERIIIKNDNDDRRTLYESCEKLGERTVNPIVDWKNSDVWNYIRSEKLTYNPLYDCGFSRVGCVGCPIAGNARYKEFARYPKYEAMYKRAFAKLIEKRKVMGKMVKGWETAESVFRWWMEDRNPDGQTDLFGNVVGEEE